MIFIHGIKVIGLILIINLLLSWFSSRYEQIYIKIIKRIFHMVCALTCVATILANWNYRESTLEFIGASVRGQVK